MSAVDTVSAIGRGLRLSLLDHGAEWSEAERRMPRLTQKQTKSETTRAIGDALLQLSVRLYRLESEALESVNPPLTLRQFRILDRVDRETASMTQLAALARRRLPTISKSVDSLVRQGLLVRTLSPTDRRVSSLELTPAGETRLAQARGAVAELASYVGAILLRHGMILGVPPEHYIESLRACYEATEDRIRT